MAGAVDVVLEPGDRPAPITADRGRRVARLIGFTGRHDGVGADARLRAGQREQVPRVVEDVRQETLPLLWRRGDLEHPAQVRSVADVGGNPEISSGQLEEDPAHEQRAGSLPAVLAAHFEPGQAARVRVLEYLPVECGGRIRERVERVDPGRDELRGE